MSTLEIWVPIWFPYEMKDWDIEQAQVEKVQRRATKKLNL